MTTYHHSSPVNPSRPILPRHGRTRTRIPMIIISFLFLALLTRPARAQPGPPRPNSDPAYAGGNFSPSMGVIIIVLIAALFFMGFFSIYIRHCSDESSAGSGGPSRRILAGSVARSRRAPRGLDPALIESFPTFGYAAVKSTKIGKGALECAVCLTEFEDDDTLRLIPKCDHVFHPDCIDAWLVGHTTCPVCRCDLSDAGEFPNEPSDPQNDAVVEVTEENRNDSNANNEGTASESMEQPLQGRMSRNRTMRNLSFGRPRWLEKFSRSFSTGHVAVKQWENMERFTLRLPDEVRKQIVSGKLQRTTSLVVLPRESSSRRGYRTGFGEGSSRGRLRSGSVRSDRWVFSLAPPFFTRAPSVKSPKVATTTSREGSLRGSIRAESTRLPV